MKNVLFAVCIGLCGLLTVACNSEVEDGENNNTTGLVTDKDGNTYHTVTIGTQTWMLENLRTTKYNDGTAIPEVTDQNTWVTSTTGAYCNLNNQTSTVATYGRYYNWYAVNTGKLAPTGWHVPSKEECMALRDYVSSHLGSSSSVTKALASSNLWEASDLANTPGNNPSSNNSSGFTAIPGGYRIQTGFYMFGTMAPFWTTTEASSYAWEFNIYYTRDYLTIGYDAKYSGFNVRCIKDTP